MGVPLIFLSLHLGLISEKMPSLETDIDKATNEQNSSEDWGLILDICDKVSASPKGPKDAMKALQKRLKLRNPRIVLQALTLVDACVSNCGAQFHQEIASSDTVSMLRTLITRGPPEISEKTRVILKKWAENDFSKSPTLSLVPQLYQELKKDGYDFPGSSIGAPVQSSSSAIPSVPQSKNKEEDDLAKAIALSLQEAEKSKQSTSTSLYPEMRATTPIYATPLPELKSDYRKVRAVYDFEAAEENELTFLSGELITVTDDSDANWWRGYTETGEGLFPANFVTADLNAEPEAKAEKKVSFDQNVEVIEVAEVPKEPNVTEIDEPKIDKTIEMLQNADPTTEADQDTAELLFLEKECAAMGPITDRELEQIDKEDVELSDLNGSLLNAFRLYHQLMQQDPGFQQQQFQLQHQQPPPQMVYGAMPPTMPQQQNLPPQQPPPPQ